MKIAIIGSRPECGHCGKAPAVRGNARCGGWLWPGGGWCDDEPRGLDRFLVDPDGGNLCGWVYGHFDARGAYGRVGG